jgi:hypothetical protein
VNRESRSEAGFALIIALLSLMLLTFLGLTLAMTTSTELQIATNYRWGQQALYNAEAGLDVARAILMRVGDGQLLLPDARAFTWDPSTVTEPVPASNQPMARFAASRNFEGFGCDKWGNGTGFGQVLVDPNNAVAPFENVNQVFGQRLRGTFTIWIRRDLSVVTGPPGALQDNPVGENVTVTSEGTAPFGSDAGAFQRANRAVRRLESVVSLTDPCQDDKTEEKTFHGCGA